MTEDKFEIENLKDGNGEAIGHLRSVILALNAMKSEDRRPSDRYLAIAITDAEKLIAFISMFCRET